MSDKPIDVFALPVYPWAARFPMRSAEDLQAMAASIAANGVRFPVVIGTAVLIEGDEPRLCLVDGRNRLAACRIAGITPPHVMLNGEDVEDYIADANLDRRDLTKGQKAMLIAVRNPKRQQGKKRTSAESAEVSVRRIEAARQVITYCPAEVVERVIAGTTGLDEAVEQAQTQRRTLQADDARLAKLTTSDPDLVDRVRDGQLKLGEAEAVATKRRDDERRDIREVAGTDRTLHDAVGLLDGELLTKFVGNYLAHREHFDFNLAEHVAHWQKRLSILQEAIHDQESAAAENEVNRSTSARRTTASVRAVHSKPHHRPKDTRGTDHS